MLCYVVLYFLMLFAKVRLAGPREGGKRVIGKPIPLRGSNHSDPRVDGFIGCL